MSAGAAAVSAAGLTAARATWARQPRTADVIVRGGLVHDGSAAAPTQADVAMSAGRIVAVGDVTGWSAARTIDAAGKVVAPGFIDTHSHAAESLVRRGLHSAEALLAQGVTTIVVNPDGGGPVDLDVQRSRWRTLGIGVNVASLLGHGSVRGRVIGGEARPPSTIERERMHGLHRRAHHSHPRRGHVLGRRAGGRRRDHRDC